MHICVCNVTTCKLCRKYVIIMTETVRKIFVILFVLLDAKAEANGQDQRLCATLHCIHCNNDYCSCLKNLRHLIIFVFLCMVAKLD